MTVFGVGWAELLEVIVVSSVAGVVATAVFSLAILCFVRAGEARRAHHGGPRIGWSLGAAVSLLGVLAGVFAGLHVVAS